MCYVKCQNDLVNASVQLLEHLSFGLRSLSFLLSKFDLQLKLIQSLVLVEILGICVTSSILRVLGLRVTSPKFQGLSSRFLGVRVLCTRVPESRVWGSQDLRVLGHRIQGLRVLGLRTWFWTMPWKVTPAQMFFCEYWEVSKNTYFEEQRTALSEVTLGSDSLEISFWRVAFKTILT